MAILTNAKNIPVIRWIIALILLIPAIAGVIWDEVLLAAPIIALREIFGFWPGFVIFCLIWAGMGLFVFSVWLRIEPWVKTHVFEKIFGLKAKTENEAEQAEKPQNWRERLVMWISGFARSLGALAAAVILGPVFGWSVFKLLGYRERDVYAFTFVAAWIFGAIWYPFYAEGVWGFGLSNLF